jgi:hypothetical protein
VVVVVVPLLLLGRPAPLLGPLVGPLRRRRRR